MKRPQITLKVAMSLDGKIATASGDAKWLSGLEARRWAHSLRAQVDAILVGANTVIADDPALTVRHVEGKDPLRIVLDSRLRTPLSSQLYGEALAQGTIIFTVTPDPQKEQELKRRGVQVLRIEADEKGRIALPPMLRKLEEMGYRKILVEGGGKIHGSFLSQRLVDRLYCVLTPHIIGDDGRSAFSLKSPHLLADAIHFARPKTQSLGDDILLKIDFSQPS